MRITVALLSMLLVAVVAACAPVRPSEAHGSVGAASQGGQWFRQTGCTDCHSVSSYQLWNIAAVGPDLSLAVEDVPKRFGQSLEEFLHAPSGTMAMVLSTRIPLTADQRNEAIQKLHEAYRRHKGLPDPIPPSKSH